MMYLFLLRLQFLFFENLLFISYIYLRVNSFVVEVLTDQIYFSLNIVFLLYYQLNQIELLIFKKVLILQNDLMLLFCVIFYCLVCYHQLLQLSNQICLNIAYLNLWLQNPIHQMQVFYFVQNCFKILIYYRKCFLQIFILELNFLFFC